MGTTSDELRRVKEILDLDSVPLDCGYETGPDLDRVRKFHERCWRTWLVFTDRHVQTMPVVYVAGSQNRLHDWRLVRYEKYSPADPNLGWWWRCTVVVAHDGADLIMQELSLVTAGRYPRRD